VPFDQYWGDPVSSNDSPALNSSLKFVPIDEYFNLNPLDFGLNYSIFVPTVVNTTITTSGVYPTKKPISPRQVSLPLPGACYDDCNNCAVEVQQTGKTPSICRQGSSFLVLYGNCKSCISNKQTASTAGVSKIEPAFKQYLNYCDVIRVLGGGSGPASGGGVTAQAVTTSATAQPTSAPRPPSSAAAVVTSASVNAGASAGNPAGVGAGSASPSASLAGTVIDSASLSSSAAGTGAASGQGTQVGATGGSASATSSRTTPSASRNATSSASPTYTGPVGASPLLRPRSVADPTVWLWIAIFLGVFWI